MTRAASATPWCAPIARWSVRLLVLAATTWIALGGAAAASAEEPVTVSNVTLTVQSDPSGVTTKVTAVVLTASALPRSTPGIVTFLAGGRPIGSAPLVSGVAVLDPRTFAVGIYEFTAQVNRSPSGSSGATSSPVSLTVTDLPQVLLASPSGAVLSPGGPVAAGTMVRVQGKGFRPNALVQVEVNGRPVPAPFTTSPLGTGSTDYQITQATPSGLYSLEASDGERSALVVFYVYNPTSSPGPEAGRPGAPTPVPSAPGVIGVDVPSNGTQGPPPGSLPATGSQGSLPQTGAQLLPLASASLTLLAVGAFMIGATPARSGATSPSDGNRHLSGAPRDTRRHDR
jgi:hypothetical protein